MVNLSGLGYKVNTGCERCRDVFQSLYKNLQKLACFCMCYSYAFLFSYKVLVLVRRF